MAEVTRCWRWPSRGHPNGCWVAGWLRTPVCGEVRPHTQSEMKRKVMNTGKLRLSPNEEAFILKEDYERRRKLRLLQVREQERGIAFQRREDIKQRRNQQFSRLAEELRAEWEEAQSQKIQNLEKLYLASLRHMGEGHRQAKENEPDLDALARRAAERKRKAEMRHKEALKVQKSQKEMLMKQRTRHIKARKEALLVEKERSAKVARLPPPVPAPFENIEINRIPSLKTNSSTYHHMSTFVSRQMGTKQPDAHLAAEEEARRLEGLRRQAAQERLEQFERAHVRGSQAMKKIHLAQNQERLMEELKQLQKEDLARRRQTVAQMPPQLVELPYRRSEVKEDWQRELEFAFEDMYSADRKVKGNLILHLKPEPLPAMSDQLQDEELDLSMERENRVPFAMKTQQIPSRILFKRLLNKIRSQKSLWTIKSASEDESEVTSSVSEPGSKAPTMESGAMTLEEGTLSSEQEQVMDSDRLTIESGPLSSEDKPFFCQAGAGKEQAVAVFPPVTPVPQSSVLLHPQEEAVRIRMSARHKQIMEIEEQKQKQLELLEQIEQQKLRLETDCFRAQLEEEEKRKKTQQPEVCPAPVSHATISDEDCHRQMIRNYQHQLLQQNRLHKQSVETARKRLLEYQTILKERYPSMSPTSLIPDSVISGPSQKSQKPTAASEHWDPCQRLKLSLSKYQLVQSSQVPALDQSHRQALRQGYFSQRQGETDASEILAKQSVGSREHLQHFSQVEAHQRDYEFVPKDSHALSRTLSYDGPQTLLDAGEVSQPLRGITCQTLDSQQITSEDSENISSKPTEPSSFLPLVPERSFTNLPVKLESGKVQEPFTTISKSTVSINHSVMGHMHDQPLSSSDTITAQQGNLKFLQEQLKLQKEVLQARQEAQEKLAFCTQKELEKQASLPVFFPSSAGDFFTSLPSTSAESGKIQASSAESDATVSSGNMDTLWGFSLPVLSQQTNLEFLQDQINVQKDNLQARREAQEVLLAHKQSKLDEIVQSEQTGPSGPHQVAQQSFSSLTLADRKIQEQPLPTNQKGLLPSQSEISSSQDGSSSFLQQILPLHSSLKLLPERLATQRDAVQARGEAQEEFLLHREGSLEDTRSRPGNSLSSVVAQHSDASRAVSESEPERPQELNSSEETILPSNHLITPALEEESRGFPQHNLTRQEQFATLQEQAHLQRVILGAGKEIQEYAHKENELEKGLCSQQTGDLSSPSQVAEWERFQEFVSVKNDSTGPLSLKIPGFQERLLRFSQHTFPLQNNLQEHQEWVDQEKESSQFSPQTRENSSSQQTGFSSFMPSLGPSSCVSLPSAASGTTQQPLSTGGDSQVTSSHLQIPELQDRLVKIAQLIQPQQDSLKALQEQLATQRETIIQSRQEAHEEILREWKERVFPEQVGPSSPLIPQHSRASFSLSDSERTQELRSTNSGDAISLGCSEMLGLPGRALGLSHTALPQQNNLTAHPEHLHAQTNSFHSTEKAQEELVFPRPCRFEEIPGERFIQPHHGDLKALQQQLDMQKKVIRSGQEMQEELLLQRLNELEQRVSCKQISSSSVSSQVALPVANSEGTLRSFPTKSDDTEMPRSRGEYLSFSQPLLPQHSNLTRPLDLEMTSKELLLHKPSSQDKGDSPEHAIPALFLSKEIEHPFIPLPFAEAKSESFCELYLPKKERAAPSSDSVTPRLQNRLLSYSQPVLTQQDNMRLQKQLNLQREALHCRQKAQEELLVQRQTALQQQIEKHRETLKDFLDVSQARKPTGENDLKVQPIEQLRGWLPHIRGSAWGDSNQESASSEQPRSVAVLDEHRGEMILLSGESLGKELNGRASKPPVSKVKCGLDLNQHELSTIQEVESPASGRTSMPGKRDFYQDRDPLRVSISREQSFLGSPLARDPFDCHQPPAQNSGSHDYDESVQVKESDAENHAILSHAVSEEGCTYLGPIVKPDDKAETQEISQEALSSVTVSTGSFLSYEITDLSLTDPESFSEQMEHQEQESTSKQSTSKQSTSKQEGIYQQLHTLGANESLLPSEEERASDHTRVQQIRDKDISEANLIPEKRDLQVPAVDLDFPELEHIFPHLHHQLFKPLEPYLDFDLSSSSGISQDNRDFYESSNVKVSSTSTVCFTALRANLHSSNSRLNQQPDVHLAHAAAQTFAAEGSEQSFQQLLPEFSSQESQHADLPSIYSIEARGTYQSMENQNYSEQTEIPQNKKKSVHFQSSTENLSPVCSSPGDATVFDQLHLQHSTPCGSISSECSGKQLESKEEMSGFQELSRKVVTMSDSQRLTKNENEAINPHVKFDSEGNSQSIQIKTERNLSQLAQAEHITNSKSFQSSIPVWETESGYGIMEEPDLTLVSTSDISIAETDLANLTLEDNEAPSCFQEGAFLTPSPTETSDYGAVSEPCVNQPQVTLSATSMKRKNTCTGQSYQKQREMRSKTQLPQTGSSLNRLKGVNKVRAPLPEERKARQALTHQRALRLYRQLAEVRQQREEKAKQEEVRAQNKARAKEFHKVSRSQFLPSKVLTQTKQLNLIFIPSAENIRETSSQKYMLTSYKLCKGFSFSNCVKGSFSLMYKKNRQNYLLQINFY
ncbi:centrosomal protein of 295 kDa isoform X3 [Peromyscus maniculatus bairdii]|uniref:centrosomal protein of 295 kDa isoform X3 n=2 Tax=Peromyscus maniculatus bairdii TaxID=230844 RepID=UPI001C2E1B4A|nr:centrosomal protein of 295 kDa isoform X3 [Peromyscus maniculatus bairdii]